MYGVTAVGNSATIYGETILQSRLQRLLSGGFAATMTGMTVTAIIQSSSATNSIAVKLSDAKLLEQNASFYIIMGANIGTTVTAYLSIISTFDISYYIAALLFFAILTAIITKNIKLKNMAMIVCSISMIFIGLILVNSSITAFKDIINNIFAARTNRFVLIVMALTLTALFQSSSLTSVLLVSMAAASSIDIKSAYYMVIGINIGACASVILASIGCKKQGIVCAIFHLLFNIIGAMINIFLIEFRLLVFLINSPIRPDIKIALYHTFFNTVTTLFLFYFVPEICAMLNRMLRKNLL